MNGEQADGRAYPGGVPAASTPPRRRNSVRRTTTHDSMRPEGFSGPVVLVSNGRDLITAAGGEATVLDAVRLDVMVNYLKGSIAAIAATPSHPRLAELVGVRAFSGFRSAVEDALPAEAQSHSVRFQLLDELPAAVLASGRAMRAAGIPIDMRGAALPVDVCAGWANGGTLLTGMTKFGPPLHLGPRAPALETDDDVLAWHAIAPLPAHATRRCRRLDLWKEDDRVWIDSFFRDSHVDADGVETVVHEWHIQAELDPATRRFVSAAAQMGPLPYPECPGAAASARRLVGMSCDGLRRAVRSSFVGTSTCTHLNDTLRSMEDAAALLDALRA